MTAVEVPPPGRDAALDFVGGALTGLYSGELTGSGRFGGGQTAADSALAGFDVTRYANRRNDVWPIERRGASALSPYIRHGLLSLRSVWNRVADGPEYDVRKFRDELLWQEFARHWYARLGAVTRRGIRRELAVGRDAPMDEPLDGWDRSMRCLDETVGELERDGWLVNQTRMWLSSDWSVRNGWRWRDGDDAFFRHLLDGSRAANRLGWQWTTGVGSSKHYGFSRWQVEKRAPEWCRSCDRRNDCPIDDWPDDPVFVAVEPPASVKRAAGDVLTGPVETDRTDRPEVVWLTAESLGDDDPALAANPELPVVFVFDRSLLKGLQLTAKRLVFLVEALSELATRREVELHIGAPSEVLGGRSVAVTHAPVPGFASVARSIDPVEVHPWPWLCPPSTGSVWSFSAWRKSVRQPR